MEKHPPHPRRRRPFGVVVLIVLQLFTFLLSASVLVGLATIYMLDVVPDTLDLADLDLLAVVLEAIFSMVSVYGLWRLRRWAWYLIMLQLGLGMTTDLYNYYNETPEYLSMLFNVLIVLYLNQREVQQVFVRRTHEPAAVVPVGNTP